MEPKMTSSSRTKSSRTGFTLVELLVVMGIILVLMGLALPMITRAYRNGVRARMQADLQVIAAGLDAYKADFKDIPRSDPLDGTWGGSKFTGHLRGAGMLCWALVAPGNATGTGGDGANGPGFRIRTTEGQVYGPYINPDHIKVLLLSTAGDNHNYCLADTYGNPYLYYPAYTGGSITVGGGPNGGGYVGSSSKLASSGVIPMFDTDDNDTIDVVAPFQLGLFARSPADTNGSWPSWRLYVMLGDINHTGAITGTETAKTTGPYILWGLGPDGAGGPDDPTNPSIISQCDDITNFTQ
jgi:prepilin-type N-terminal cleavage/methylation domain-containing protein